MKYIINTNEAFKGTCINAITNYPIVDYTEGKKWEDYKKDKEEADPTIKLELIDTKQFDEKLETYYKSLVSEWSEVDEDRYMDALECLPPMKWHDLESGINIFYISEAYTGDLHTAYIHARNRGENKYFSATRRLRETDAELLESIKTVLYK